MATLTRVTTTDSTMTLVSSDIIDVSRYLFLQAAEPLSSLLAAVR